MNRRIIVAFLILIFTALYLSACTNDPNETSPEITTGTKAPGKDAVSADPEDKTGADAPDEALYNLPNRMPDDFAIRFVYSIVVDNIYDTYSGTIQKDLIADGVATANFTPAEGVLRDIYEKFTDYKIYTISRRMTSDELTRDDSGVMVMPLTTYEINVTADGRTYHVRGDETAQYYTATDEDAKNFIEFVNFMLGTLYDTPEYKDLPDAVGGYA